MKLLLYKDDVFVKTQSTLEKQGLIFIYGTV